MHPTDLRMEGHVCTVPRGSTDWATEHDRCTPASGLNCSWGELAHPSQVKDSFMPLGITPVEARSPQNALTFQDLSLYKA